MVASPTQFRPVYTVAEVAAQLGISPDAVRARIHARRLTAFRTSSRGRWRVLGDINPPSMPDGAGTEQATRSRRPRPDPDASRAADHSWERISA